MVCIENRNTGDFKVITRAEAAARAIALNQELKYMDYPDERTELCNCVVNLCEAVKEAKRQGDPTDPAVRRDRLKSMRKVSMVKHDGGVILKPSEQTLVSRYFKNLSI
jgi:hypothetical protein